MSDQQPTPEQIVGAYISACRPPINATTTDVAHAISAWNEIVAKLEDADKKQEQKQ